MFILNIHVGQVNWALTFREASACDKEFKAIQVYVGQMDAHLADTRDRPAPLVLEDEFGLTMQLNEAPHTFQKAGAAKFFEGQGLTSIVQHREQLKAQQMAAKDPELMFLTGAMLHNDGGAGRLIRPNGS